MTNLVPNLTLEFGQIRSQRPNSTLNTIFEFDIFLFNSELFQVELEIRPSLDII